MPGFTFADWLDAALVAEASNVMQGIDWQLITVSPMCELNSIGHSKGNQRSSD